VGQPGLHDARGRGRHPGGILAGSVALIGFGIDSAIEGLASAIIVWRFTGHSVFSDTAEQRAQKLVAIQFFRPRPLCGARVDQSACRRRAARPQLAGIALSASSLVVMPYLGIAKQRLADQLGGTRTCSPPYLAGALLLGLLANALLGAWA
jgi:hypothetical protein